MTTKKRNTVHWLGRCRGAREEKRSTSSRLTSLHLCLPERVPFALLFIFALALVERLIHGIVTDSWNDGKVFRHRRKRTVAFNGIHDIPAYDLTALLVSYLAFVPHISLMLPYQDSIPLLVPRAACVVYEAAFSSVYIKNDYLLCFLIGTNIHDLPYTSVPIVFFETVINTLPIHSHMSIFTPPRCRRQRPGVPIFQTLDTQSPS